MWLVYIIIGVAVVVGIVFLVLALLPSDEEKAALAAEEALAEAGNSNPAFESTADSDSDEVSTNPAFDSGTIKDKNDEEIFEEESSTMNDGFNRIFKLKATNKKS